jgi:hypothetical protein
MSSGFMLLSFGCRIWLMLNAVSAPGMRFSLPPNGSDAEKERTCNPFLGKLSPQHLPYLNEGRRGYPLEKTFS